MKTNDYVEKSRARELDLPYPSLKKKETARCVRQKVMCLLIK